jgi:hypothetical protein
MIIRILLLMAILVSFVWFVVQPGYEPVIAIISSLLAFIGDLLHQNKLKQQASQSQTVSNKGIGIQAGRDVSVGRTRKRGKTTDAK